MTIEILARQYADSKTSEDDIWQLIYDAFISGSVDKKQEAVYSEQEIKEISSIAWMSAANAYRLYPDNKHTFGDYWDDLGKSKVKKLANT